MPIPARRDRRRRSQYLQKKAEARTSCVLASATLQKGRAGWHLSRRRPMSQELGLGYIGHALWAIDRPQLDLVVKDGDLDGPI